MQADLVSEVLFASAQDRVQVIVIRVRRCKQQPVLKRYLPVFKIDCSGLELSFS